MLPRTFLTYCNDVPTVGVYKNTLIIPGMTEHLLKDIEHLELEQLLVELGRMWNEFMTTILPTLEVLEHYPLINPDSRAA